jgi:hypothetical protein
MASSSDKHATVSARSADHQAPAMRGRFGPPGFDRAAFHRAFNGEVFRKHLARR